MIYCHIMFTEASADLELEIVDILDIIRFICFLICLHQSFYYLCLNGMEDFNSSQGQIIICN